jgi:hypothetical protein
MSQIEDAQKLLDRGCAALGLQTDVKVAQVRFGTVWVLAYDQAPDKPHFANAMIRLERWLKADSGNPNIELQCEAIEDKNKRHVRMGISVHKGASLRGVESLE